MARVDGAGSVANVTGLQVAARWAEIADGAEVYRLSTAARTPY